MELREYWRVIRKRLLFILAIPIIAAAISGVYAYKFAKPVYEASAVILLQVPNITEMPDPSTASGIVATQLFDEAVIQSYPTLGLTPTQVAQYVNANINGELMSFYAVGPSQAAAAALANDVAETFIEQAPSLVGMPNSKMVTPADSSSRILPISPHKKRLVLIASGIGLLLSVGIAFMLEYLDVRVRTEADLIRYLYIPVLGSVQDYHGKLKAKGSKSQRRRRAADDPPVATYGR